MEIPILGLKIFFVATKNTFQNLVFKLDLKTLASHHMCKMVKRCFLDRCHYLCAVWFAQFCLFYRLCSLLFYFVCLYVGCQMVPGGGSLVALILPNKLPSTQKQQQCQCQKFVFFNICICMCICIFSVFVLCSTKKQQCQSQEDKCPFVEGQIVCFSARKDFEIICF